jgi:hypothetical protein
MIRVLEIQVLIETHTGQYQGTGYWPAESDTMLKTPRAWFDLVIDAFISGFAKAVGCWAFQKRLCILSMNVDGLILTAGNEDKYRTGLHHLATNSSGRVNWERVQSWYPDAIEGSGHDQ